MPPYRPIDVATVYVAFFAARTDVYSIWVVGPDPQKPIGWRPVREELTAEVALAGLTRSGPSISGYFPHPTNTSHVLAVDFDTDDGLQQAYTLSGVMSWEGIPAYVETSRRGGHLWCVLDAQIPAVAIRFALRALMAEGRLPTDDPHIELRPGTDRIGEGGLGHALRLPFMPHPKTGETGTMVGPKGPVPRTLARVILDWELADAKKLLAWSEKWDPPVARLPANLRNPREPFPEDDSTASQILISLWGVLNAAPGKSVRCPAHQDKMPSLSIFRDDRRAVCKAPHCILNNDDHGRGTYELRKLAPTQSHT